MLLSSAIIFPRLRTSSAQLRAASAIRWQRFHTVPACLIFNSRASSRRTSLQLPVARYLALHRHTESSPGRTISRTSPEAIRTMSCIAAYHQGTQPSLALRTQLCSERSEWSSKGPNSDLDCGIPSRYPASHLWPIRTKVRSRLRHTTKVPSHLWLTTRSITRSRRPWQ